MVNSAFHPSGVDKWVPATCLGKCVRITSVGWQVKLRDPIWQVISRAVSHIMHYTNWPLLYFTFSTVGYSWRNSWPVEYHTSELEKTSDVRLKGFLPLLFNDRGLIVSAVGVSVHQTAGQNHRQRYELHLANHVAVCSQDRVKYSRPGQKMSRTHRLWLIVPRCRRKTFGCRAFSVASPSVWNALPDSLIDPELTLDIFRRHLKTYFFTLY